MIDNRSPDIIVDDTSPTVLAIRSFGRSVCGTGRVTHIPLGLLFVGCAVALGDTLFRSNRLKICTICSTGPVTLHWCGATPQRHMELSVASLECYLKFAAQSKAIRHLSLVVWRSCHTCTAGSTITFRFLRALPFVWKSEQWSIEGKGSWQLKRLCKISSSLSPMGLESPTTQKFAPLSESRQ
jgi:hypothetical protein